MGSFGCLEHLSVKRVYIILVNWNGWRDTLECMNSLMRLTYSDFRIIICDNASSDDSRGQIKNWATRNNLPYAEYQCPLTDVGGTAHLDPLLTLIATNRNLGFAAGNNVGMRYALARDDAAYCWLLNNDTIVEPDALEHLVSRMRGDESIGICGSTIRLYHDRERIQALGGGYYCRWIGLPWHYGRFFKRWDGTVNQLRAESWMNYVEGASMLVSRQFLERVGYMSEDYFLYFEEADWALRAKNQFRLGYAPQSIIYHKVGGSIGTCSNPLNKSSVCDYYNIRNRIRFTRRFYPALLPMVYLVLVGECMIRLLSARWERAFMILGLMLQRGADLEKRP
ncbi:glycosyl transferase family 2 [Geobacter sp. AOG1]|nr:glycosyl transferase family 2 [Geobacter sp. AOG1]